MPFSGIVNLFCVSKVIPFAGPLLPSGTSAATFCVKVIVFSVVSYFLP